MREYSGLEKIFALCFLFCINGCGKDSERDVNAEPSRDEALSQQNSSSTRTSIEAFPSGSKVGPQSEPSTSARSNCTMPQGVNSAPNSIGEMISFINALPLPVTLPCILDALPRPFGINASSGTFSAQPASGPNNPRIFILLNSLVLSIVPDGEGSDLLEMSELLNNRESIKAEIKLPVTTALSASEAFDRIARKDGISGTACSGCHGGESSAPKYGGKAFVSRALRQSSSQVVPLSFLLGLKKNCESTNSKRCLILKALLGPQEASINEILFPSDMPTMF